MHFRQNRKQQSNFQFKYGSTTREYCPYYKYLGLYLDANLNFNNGIRTLADSGGQAFSAVISKLKYYNNVRYKIFTTIFYSQIATILDYSSSIWSHKKLQSAMLFEIRQCNILRCAWVYTSSSSKWRNRMVAQ